MTNFYSEMANVAHELLQEFGMQASLLRNGEYRDCYVAVIEYSPKDPATQLANPTERTVLFDPLYGAVPDTPPDNELDQLVTYIQPMATPPVINEVLPFTGAPVKLFSPAGLIILYQATVKR